LENGLVELPHANDLAHDLGVESGAFGLGIDLFDVLAKGALFFLQALDALDERLELVLGESAKLLDELQFGAEFFGCLRIGYEFIDELLMRENQ